MQTSPDLMTPEHFNREHDPARLAALESFQLFGTALHDAYDQLVLLAQRYFDMPTAAVVLLGAKELWFKSSCHPNGSTVSLDDTFCRHDLHVPGGLLVEDARSDARFCNSPYVTRAERPIVFYVGAPIQTRDGHIIGTLCMMDSRPRRFSADEHDMLRIMANQVLAQMELYKNHQIMRTQMQALTAKHEELEQLNSSKDRFFSIIAHDLRAPFQGILGFSEVLANEFDEMSPSEIRNLALYLHDTAASAYKLLDNLLQWSMLESGKMRFHPKHIAIEDLFDEVEGSLVGVARQKGVQLLFQPALARTLYGDVNMVRTILQNLVNNAIKFTPANGRVEVKTLTGPGGVCLKIRDTGVGMSRKQCQKLFSNDVHDSTRGTSGETGTGLGLVLTRQFVQRHGGTLEVQSTPGQGTTITVCFPHEKAAVDEGSTNSGLHLMDASP